MRCGVPSGVHRLIAVLAFVLLAAAACSDDEADTATGTDGATTSTIGAATTTVAPVTTTTTSDRDFTIGIENFAFDPATVTVSVGETVTWKNLTASSSHTATSVDDAWESATLAGGETFSVTFDTAGTYPYFCAIHPSMTGTIEVVDG